MRLLQFLTMFMLMTSVVTAASVELTSESQSTNTCPMVACCGTNGLPGRDGREGKDGPRGDKGDSGVRGLQGPPGKAGPPGAVGTSGLKGDHGTAGQKGQKGESAESEIVVLKRQVSALELQLKTLQDTTNKQRKASLLQNARSVGQKLFVTNFLEQNFEAARVACVKAGGVLASPRNAAENAALQEIVAMTEKSAYLGINDRNTEGTFVYPTGEKIAYTNWSPREPNNDHGIEDCVEIFSGGKWNDKSCGETPFLLQNARNVGDKLFATNYIEASYEEARVACVKAGGLLASPKNAAENAAIQEIVVLAGKSAFLGINDIMTEGTFRYLNAERLGYTNWKPNEPNNYKGIEDCVYMEADGRWNDLPCEHKRLTVCEF